MPTEAMPAAEAVRPLLRVRQVREFTDEAPSDAQLAAIADAGRWSGSASNEQPWRFIVIRDRATLARFAEAGMPQTRLLTTAPAAIAVALPDDEERPFARAYDEGRAVERMLVAAHLVGLAGGIGWVRKGVAAPFVEALAVPQGWTIHTILAVGHPSEAAKAPKSKPGEARLPREQTVFEERWPADEG